jgi:hypothetical protein
MFEESAAGYLSKAAAGQILIALTLGFLADFASIKNTSRDDILAAHRVPPRLSGMI